MAGAPWLFTLLPDSINTVTITDGSTTVTVNRGSGKTDNAFLTGAFTETTIVTISATGYNDLTNITVGDTNLVMTPIQTKPEHLYGWTDSNTAGETLYAWTSNDYYDEDDHTKQLTVYTYAKNPSINDQLYKSVGETWDGKCWTGAEPGSTASTVTSYSNDTIQCGDSIPDPVIPERP